MIFKVIIVGFAAVSVIKGLTIECNFHEMGWEHLENVYTCYDATLTSDGNLTHVINVVGNHLSGKTNADVKAFDLKRSHEHLNRIPMGMEQFLPNLLVLGWTDGNLATLTADDLKTFPDLEVLYAYGNKLVSLDGDLFKHTPKLQLIHFGINLLEHVGIGLLDSSYNLKIALFQMNPCIDMIAWSPAEIPELQLALQNQCAPLEQCPVECFGLIETLKEENRRQNEEIARHGEEIAAQAGEMVKQKDEIAALSDAIQVLEKSFLK